jgi:hypothetical protein
MPKYHTTAMYVIDKARKIFHTKFMGIFIIYLHKKFQMHNFNGLFNEQKSMNRCSLVTSFLFRAYKKKFNRNHAYLKRYFTT